MPNTTLLLSHTAMLKHDCANHPENASRLEAILTELHKSPYAHQLDLSTNRLATGKELALAHTPAYIDHIFSLDGQEQTLDVDTYLAKDSLFAARLAAGLGLELVERVINGRTHNGFALVRPPGHHACADKAMGFCIFNNIAIAAKRALELGLKRVAIVDFDVHHGNGTQEIFYDDNRVLFIDMHQDSLFPISSGAKTEQGRDAGLGFTVNIPLPHSQFDEDYLAIFDQQIQPLLTDYQPELILVSAGFDAHEDDPLASMRLSSKGYGLLVKRLKSLAEQLCDGKLVFFLEGGYNPTHLAQDVLECVHAISS